MKFYSFKTQICDGGIALEITRDFFENSTFPT
jgi:hypothetical protein